MRHTMRLIIEWLESQKIAFEYDGRLKQIRIILEANCTWVNGFQEEMKYDNRLAIWKTTYKEYVVVEQTGYMSHTARIKTGKQSDVIEYLGTRLIK